MNNKQIAESLKRTHPNVREIIVLEAKQEVFDAVEEWLSLEDDWRAWDANYLDKYDKMKKEQLGRFGCQNCPKCHGSGEARKDEKEDYGKDTLCSLCGGKGYVQD